MKEIPATSTLGIIINVGTKEYTLLAIASFRKYSNLPLLVIDCAIQNSDNSNFKFLRKVADDFNFYLLSLPLNRHGITLDYIFENSTSQNLLLVDSDIEILEGNYLEFMQKHIDEPNFFGSGFISYSDELTKESFPNQNFGLYQERMYIPLTLLNVKSVRGAMNKGKSFLARSEYNDFYKIPKLAKFLFKRFKMKRLSRMRLNILNPFKKTYFGEKPCFVYNDTGADILMYLKYKEKKDFYGLPTSCAHNYLNHYHGATRKVLAPNDENIGSTGFQLTENYILKNYDIDINRYLDKSVMK